MRGEESGDSPTVRISRWDREERCEQIRERRATLLRFIKIKGRCRSIYQSQTQMGHKKLKDLGHPSAFVVNAVVIRQKNAQQCWIVLFATRKTLICPENVL
jgi:hypothetical protein